MANFFDTTFDMLLSRSLFMITLATHLFQESRQERSSINGRIIVIVFNSKKATWGHLGQRWHISLIIPSKVVCRPRLFYCYYQHIIKLTSDELLISISIIYLDASLN